MSLPDSSLAAVVPPLPDEVVTALVARLAEGPDALLHVGDDGTIQWANRAAMRLHAGPSPLIGRDITRLVADHGDEALRDIVRATIATGWARSILPVRDCHGRWFGATLSATGAGAALLVSWDVTTTRRQEQWLAAQATLLEQVAAGAPTAAVLAGLVEAIEAASPRTTGSVLRVTDDHRLFSLAGPGLPASLAAAIDGVAIGPAVGSCGTAAWEQRPVFVGEIETDPRWEGFRDLVRPHGFRACWSVPILLDAADGATRVVATFAMYLRETGLPSDDDRRMLDEAARVARVVFAAEQVRAEQRQLARILEETPDLVTTVAPDGRVLFMNRAARGFLHGTADADAHDGATLHGAMRVLAPCDPPDDPLAHARREGAWHGDVLLRRADGSWVPMLQVMLAHADETGAVRFVSTTARDLSAVRTAEAALAASEARFRALTEAAPVGVFETDRAGRCTYVNRHLANITGWSTSALLGDAWLAGVHPDDVPALLAVWDAYCRSGRSAPHSYRFTRPDGATRHLLWTTAPMTDHTGAISGHVGIVQDITAAREDEAYQEAIRRERTELAARAQHAQRMEALGALAGGVAHDFNNLLSVLRGGLELLREEVAPDGPARTEVDELLGATERATAMTQRLLAFSRHQVLQPTAIDPNAVVEGACSLLRRLVGEHITVRTTLRPLAGTVRADRGQLEQVLINLVVNARDAMPHGGEIVIETAAIDGAQEPQWAGDPGARLARLVVRDSGAGMDEATLARAMEPFFTTKPVGHGTGLGLSMAYGVVTQSGGALAIASRPGAGTTVTILLPLDATDAGPLPAVVPPPRTAPAAAPSRAGDATSHATPPDAPHRCVLVVEDEVALRQVMRRTLERAGYEVCDAADGVAGLALWRTHRDRPVAIVTDLRMPVLGGRAMVAAIRAEGGAQPVVFVSGYADESFAIDATRECFLAKPFRADALIDAIARVTHAAPVH